MALHIDVCPELSLWLIEPCNTALDIALWPIVFAGQIIYLVHGFHFFVKNFGKEKNKELGEESGKLLKPLSIGEPSFLSEFSFYHWFHLGVFFFCNQPVHRSQHAGMLCLHYFRV